MGTQNPYIAVFCIDEVFFLPQHDYYIILKANLVVLHVILVMPLLIPQHRFAL